MTFSSNFWRGAVNGFGASAAHLELKSQKSKTRGYWLCLSRAVGESSMAWYGARAECNGPLGVFLARHLFFCGRFFPFLRKITRKLRVFHT